MKYVTTDPARFTGLPGYAFADHWFEWAGLRIHYLDEGAGPPVVLFHGEPTWSFLYRHVIPVLTSAGFRAIAPDYPGFGRSDKPTDPDFYTYDTLVSAMVALVEHLDLTAATAVVQDWGGPIGLRVATEHPDRFTRLSILNTGLFTGGTASPAFLAWRSFVESHPDLPVAAVMANSAVTPWDAAVLAGYEAPFPSQEHKVGAWRLPLIVPLSENDPGAAEMSRVRERLAAWDRPAQVLFSTADPIFSVRTGERFASLIPGATHAETIDGAGHFLQEEAGEQVGAAIAAFLARTA
jgi:haloalkane dehalogenase